MRNTHDVGGMLGYGPIKHDEHSRDEFEGLALGLTLAAIANGFLRNVDENRYAKERMAPTALQNCSYYELWLAALEMNLVEHGVLELADIERVAESIRQGGARPTGFTEKPSLTAAINGMIPHSAHPPVPEDQPSSRFAVGDLVRTRVHTSRRHTRLPNFAAGRIGKIDATLPPHPVPDVVAHEDTDIREWTYRVRFEARELWGSETTSRDAVTVDLWECYLQPKENV